MDKFLLFTTGSATADPLNLDSSQAAMYSASSFKGMKPQDSRSLDLFFETSHGREIVTLKIKNGTHTSIMDSISNALNVGMQSVITVASFDTNRFINPNICGVTIRNNETYCQKLSSGAGVKEKINLGRRSWGSCTISNSHSGTIPLDLYLLSLVSTDVTSTTVVAAEDKAISSASVTLTVKTVNATADAFLNERVYKANGDEFDFIGICTGVTNTTTIVFSGGIKVAIADDDILYTGTRYSILNSQPMPTGSTLKLEGDEINFDKNTYDLYVVSSSSVNGLIDFIFHY